MILADIWHRIRDFWRREKPLHLLAIVMVLTVIVSLFEIRLDPLQMLLVVISNFITCASITLISVTMFAAAGVEELPRSPWPFLWVTLLMAIGGALGGLMSWGLNLLLFPYHISHPGIYIMMVSVLTVIFGLSMLGYESISTRLGDTAARLAEKEIQTQRILHLKTEAELEALRARVNPHFLFNTLNSIASLIPSAPDRAEDTLQRLSNLFRYILTAGDRGDVPLSDELEIVDEYLRIEKVRLGDRLSYDIRSDDSLATMTIPAMLLQPLVENAVKYAVEPDRRGGRIVIECRRRDASCEIRITDSGDGFDPEAAIEGFGIGGVRQRLELNYPGAHRFEFTCAQGCTLTIEIPIC